MALALPSWFFRLLLATFDRLFVQDADYILDLL